MMMRRILLLSSLAVILAAAAAQQDGPPVRMLAEATVVSTEKLSSVSQVRALPGGRALVNDAIARRLLLLDSSLQLIRVVADSSSGAAQPYGVRAGRLLAYRGDSSILIDPASLSMLLLDGNGDVASVTSTPRVEHIEYFAGATYGIPGIDAKGRLIYRIPDPVTSLFVAEGGGIVVPDQPDSAPVLRLDLDNRKLDTAGRVRIQRRIREPYRMSSGTITTRTLTTPMPVVDDWAVLADGSIAFVRHKDYHIDWLNPDGTWTSSKPMHFPWQPLSPAHKTAFIDSVRRALEDNRHKEIARYDSMNFVCFDIPRPDRSPEAMAAQARNPVSPLAPPAARPPAGSPAASETPAVVRPKNCPASQYIVEGLIAPVNVISPDMLPETKPPFAANSTRPDADGNLWIRVNQMEAVAKTTLYDVINRQGVLFDRVRIPDTRVLVGFGPGGIAFTAVKRDSSVTLERARWK